MNMPGGCQKANAAALQAATQRNQTNPEPKLKPKLKQKKNLTRRTKNSLVVTTKQRWEQHNRAECWLFGVTFWVWHHSIPTSQHQHQPQTYKQHRPGSKKNKVSAEVPTGLETVEIGAWELWMGLVISIFASWSTCGWQPSWFWVNRRVLKWVIGKKCMSKYRFPKEVTIRLSRQHNECHLKTETDSPFYIIYIFMEYIWFSF